MAEDSYSFVRDVWNELKKGLGPFVIQEFAEHFGPERNAHLKSLKRVLSSEPAYRSMAWENDEDAIEQIDIAGWLKVMRLRWDTVFKDKLGEEADSKDTNVLNARAYLRELIDGRNKWGHETERNQITTYDALRISGTAERLLLAVGAAELAESMRLRTEEFGQNNSAGDTEANEDIEASGKRVDLRGLNLSDTDLRGRNLRVAKLTGADLSNSNLHSENLADMDLSDVKLVKADLSNANLANSRFFRADMSDVILRDADLTGANLSHAVLEKADLRRVKIDGSDFRFANLAGIDMSNSQGDDRPIQSIDEPELSELREEIIDSEVNLSHAILRQANMRRVWLEVWNLASADMAEANLAGSRIEGVNLSGAYLRSADFTHCDIFSGDFTGAKMQDVIFEGASAAEAKFTNAEMTDANLEGFYCVGYDAHDKFADWNNVDLSRANLCDANLTDNSLRNANLTGATLINIDLERSDLTNSNLTRAVFRNANLVGANLSNTDLNETDFTGADLTCADFTGADFCVLSTILPDGSYWTKDTDITQFTGSPDDC